MKTHPNRLLVTLILAATLTVALGIGTDATAATRSKGRAVSLSSVPKPGATPFSGEPDGGQGAPLPKIVPSRLRPGHGPSTSPWIISWYGVWNLYLKR